MADNDIARIVVSLEKKRRKWKKRALRAERQPRQSGAALTNIGGQVRWRGYLPSQVPTELWEEYKAEVLGVQPKGEPPDE
jgi:hypothetical protein